MDPTPRLTSMTRPITTIRTNNREANGFWFDSAYRFAIVLLQ